MLDEVGPDVYRRQDKRRTPDRFRLGLGKRVGPLKKDE